MKKNKPVVAEAAEVPVCQMCPRHQAEITKLQGSVTEYKKAYDILKMKLQTIFNITQM